MSGTCKATEAVTASARRVGGNSVPAVFKSESHAANFIKARTTKGTKLNADEAASWDGLHKNFEVARINHEEAYSFDGACTNWAESYFSRLRRAEIGHHHHVSGHRRQSPGEGLARDVDKPAQSRDPGVATGPRPGH